jgi:drug/metabolite transporter (DMT)-like permease
MPHRANHTISHKAAYVALAVGVLGIGWSAILVRLSGVSGSTSAFYRMALAQLIFVPWRLAAPSPGRRLERGAVIAAVWAGIAFAADLQKLHLKLVKLQH